MVKLENLEQQPYHEMKHLLIEAGKIVIAQKEKGKGLAKKTIIETFEGGRIQEVQRDGYFYLFPKQKSGNLVVMSDLHGDLETVNATAKFLKDKNNHLLSLGDNIVTKFSPEYSEKQLETLEKLLHLFIKFPDQVHLCRGNCDVHIMPAGGFAEEIYQKQGLPGFEANVARIRKLFNQLPLGFVTETGVVGVHGLLPRGIRTDLNHPFNYKNLQEINSLTDYSPYNSSDSGAKFRGREVYRMLYGEIDPRSLEEYQRGPRGKEGMISGEEGVLNSLEAVGASVLVRGHQHSLAKEKGRAYSLDFNGKAGTVISHRQQGDCRIAIIPLYKNIERLTDEMFQRI